MVTVPGSSAWACRVLRSLVVVGLALAGLVATTNAAAPAQAQQAGLSIGEVTIDQPGGGASGTIIVDPGDSNLAAISIEAILQDPSVASITSAELTAEVGGSNVVDGVAICSAINGAGWAEAFELCRIDLTGNAIGETALALVATVASDANVAEISVAGFTGTVRIGTAAPPEPTPTPVQDSAGIPLNDDTETTTDDTTTDGATGTDDGGSAETGDADSTADESAGETGDGDGAGDGDNTVAETTAEAETASDDQTEPAASADQPAVDDPATSVEADEPTPAPATETEAPAESAPSTPAPTSEAAGTTTDEQAELHNTEVDQQLAEAPQGEAAAPTGAIIDSTSGGRDTTTALLATVTIVIASIGGLLGVATRRANR